MRKQLLFATTLLLVFAAHAQSNFTSVTCSKAPGSSTATFRATPTRTDSIWKKVLIISSTGSIIVGSADSGTYSGPQTMYPPVSGVDTIRCWMAIASYTRDSTTHAFVYDTTTPVVMSKLPGGSFVPSPTEDSIYYALTAYGGNNDSVPVVVKCFTDAAETYLLSSQTYYVSGASAVTFNRVIPATLSPVTNYYIRVTITNPVTGTIVIHDTVRTLSVLTSHVYLQVTSGVDSTDTSFTVPVWANVFGHPATVKFYWRDSLASAWNDSILLNYDSSVTGLQSRTAVVTGRIPGHTYVYDAKGVNTIGASWMGSRIIHTIDTTSTHTIDTSTVFHIDIISALDSGGGINVQFSYRGDGTHPLTINAALENSAASVIYTTAYAHVGGDGLRHIQRVRFVVPDTGFYFVEGWAFNEGGSEFDTTGKRLVHVASRASSTEIAEVNAERNVMEGSITVYAIDGTVVQSLKGKYGDIQPKMLPADLPYGVYMANFKSENGQFSSVKKLAKTE